MKNVLRSTLDRQRLVLLTAFFLAITGLIAWLTMPRQEDPTIPSRFGVVTCIYPGADAETIDLRIVDELEQAILRVKAVKSVVSTSRTDVAVMRVKLRDDEYETVKQWDEVRRVIGETALPLGAREPELYTGFITDQEVVVLAITGSADRRRLLTGARTVEDALFEIDGVADVVLTADPGQQVTIEYDDSLARRLGVPITALVGQIRAQNTTIPAGSIRVGGRSTAVLADAEFDSLHDIRHTEVRLPTGDTVPLSTVATVRLGPTEPQTNRMRFNGMEALGVSVVPEVGIDIVALGERVKARLADVSSAIEPLQLHVLSFQPAYVEQRLADLGRALLTGMAIVALVLMVAMGIRLGVIVASVVPLVLLAALGLFAAGGGQLHQISIASMVIAIGILVDNALVVAESVQQRVDRGHPPGHAAFLAARELGLPLATATGTTMAAFVPMLLSNGPTADFTRSIPQVLLLTLAVSYVFAMTVTPVLCAAFLRRKARKRSPWTASVAEWAGRTATRKPRTVVLAALVLVGCAAFAMRFVDRNFFPHAGRSQFMVEQMMPEGTHLSETSATSEKLEAFLLDDPRVTQVSTFVGRSAPKFYYNLPLRPRSPHFANLIVSTHRRQDVVGLMADIRRFALEKIPEAVVVPRRLEQGPPFRAPIEIRLRGEDLAGLVDTAEGIVSVLRATPGAVDVRHDQGLGVPAVQLAVNDSASGRRGLARKDIALAVLGQTRGLPAGALRLPDDSVPIVVRAKDGENLRPSRLLSVDVASTTAGAVPLAQVAVANVQWKPAAIHRRNRTREVTVSAQVSAGASYRSVLAEFAMRFDSDRLPPNVTMELGGAAETAQSANTSLVRAAPLGVLLLLFFLMFEFNSFRRVGLILVTVPLAMAGIVPGLLLNDQPFGFMSLLGVIALVGVVVNNAIVLVDSIESGRQSGLAVTQAVAQSIQLRARAILLTSATTVTGLIPLAISPSPLWPPLASAMISGLVASTFLGLLVVPALYVLLFLRSEAKSRQTPPRELAATTIVAGLVLTLWSPTVSAFPLSKAMSEAAQRPDVRAAQSRADAAEAAADAEWRRAYLPLVSSRGSVSSYDRLLRLRTPIGNFGFGAQSFYRASVRVTQPIFDPKRLFGVGPAADLDATAARATSLRTAQLRAAEAAGLFLDVKTLDASLRATDALIVSLRSRAERVRAAVGEGRALKIDQLRVDLALANAQQDRRRLALRREAVREALAQAMGLSASEDPGAIDRIFDVPSRDSALTFLGKFRHDITALTQRAAAAKRRVSAEWWSLMPRVQARGELVASDGLPYTTDHYLLGSIDLVWQPFEAGTRFARATAGRAEYAALASELRERTRTVRVETVSAYAALRAAQGDLRVARQGVKQAQQAVEVEQLRYDAGRIVISELLESQTQLRDQRMREESARLDIPRAQIRIRLAIGDLD